MTMMDIIKKLLLKDRTHVSAGFGECMAVLSDEIPMKIHRYASGKDYGTWIIPQEWNPKKAVLSDGEKVIASYEDHPLFLVSYSRSFKGWVEREELLKHIKTSQAVPDAFAYEHRLACDYRRRLKEWMLSLPYETVRTLDKPRYFVDIEVEVKDGHMLVGESTLKGRNDYTFAFLAHLDHTGQSNDGLANVAVGVELMKRLRKEFPNPKFNYQLLVGPECMGSVAYLADNPSLIDSYLGTIFIEMAGLKAPVRVGRTRMGDAYLDRVLQTVMTERGKPFDTAPFEGHWGNDELIFDSPGVGVPSAAMERAPFPYYHTSRDDLSVTHEESLEEIVDILLDMVRVLEADFIPKPRHRVPVYQTRYNLYADWENDRAQYDLNQALIFHFWSGLSILDIAAKIGSPFRKALDYAMKFVKNDLMETLPQTPEYFRRGTDPIKLRT